MIPQVLTIVLSLLCTACAQQPQGGATIGTTARAAQTSDPLEPFNRSVTKLNSGLTKILIKPVVTLYRLVLPRPVRRLVSNVSANAKAPLIFGHDILQGESDRAFQTLTRFLMNSTVGLGGALDVAAKAGVPGHEEDAGQTLARWGVPSGPYLVLPLLGPSSLRDSLGFAGDIFADPMRYVLRSPTVQIGYVASPVGAGVSTSRHRQGVRGDIGTGLLVASILSQLDENVDRLDELERGAIDPYVALREAYGQYRQSEISNGRAPAQPEEDPMADVLGAPQ